MFFGKKKSGLKCNNCKSNMEKDFDFCPYCGSRVGNLEKERRDFGMLGKNDAIKEEIQPSPLAGMGITDKMLNSLINSMMKSIDQQFRQANTQNNNIENASIEHLPNGIKIKIGMPANQQISQPKPKQAKKKEITQEQLERMSKLPRAEAKSKIKRLSDRIVYELAVSGLESPEDVLISKLEAGYEIKAIGKKKVYTNSIPVTLPLRGFSFNDKVLSVEFKIQK